MGQATATTLPAPPPVDLAKYAGTWYEQGSVKQFFSIGLVNIKAVYTDLGDGTLKVENSGNYFGPNGPESKVAFEAAPVNSPTNTRLAVGFFPANPDPSGQGLYWILDYDPDYEWAIVSDPTGFSGWILTREQDFRTQRPEEYEALVERAKQLGVKLRITPTEQYPVSVVVGGDRGNVRRQLCGAAGGSAAAEFSRARY
jgi:lipocalin